MTPDGQGRPGDEGGLRIEPDPYCPEHGNQPTAYTDCSCEGRAVLNLRRRAEAAEAEASNLSADYDRRGERLWRLATLAGHVPCDSDNDATAELAVAEALAARRPAAEDGAARLSEEEREAADFLQQVLDDGGLGGTEREDAELRVVLAAIGRYDLLMQSEVSAERDAFAAELSLEADRAAFHAERAEVHRQRADAAEALLAARRPADEDGLRALRDGIERLADSIEGDDGYAHNSGCEGEPDCFACIIADLRHLARHPAEPGGSDGA